MKLIDAIGPEISASRMTLHPDGDWPQLEKAFTKAAPLPFQQGWRASPEPELEEAWVRTGWNDSGLLILAELGDRDIFNPVTTFNQPSFLEGDVFEIFLRPSGGERYFELHVNPRNQVFQLCIPSERDFRAAGDDGINRFKVHEPMFSSRVDLKPESGCWRVFSLIPFSAVCEGQIPEPGEEWTFSFSRYDYSRNTTVPVLSSTSPHRQLDFHRQEEWGTIRFE